MHALCTSAAVLLLELVLAEMNVDEKGELKRRMAIAICQLDAAPGAKTDGPVLLWAADWLCGEQAQSWAPQRSSCS